MLTYLVKSVAGYAILSLSDKIRNFEINIRKFMVIVYMGIH